jgi:hypothetical protein
MVGADRQAQHRRASWARSRWQAPAAREGASGAVGDPASHVRGGQRGPLPAKPGEGYAQRVARRVTRSLLTFSEVRLKEVQRQWLIGLR